MLGNSLIFLVLTLSSTYGQKAVSGPSGVIPDGPRGNETLPAFKQCGKSSRCFDVRLGKVIVKIGNDGTNDDVQIKVCSDDGSACCTTPPLKSILSDDWSQDDVETWEEKYLGDCRNKTFTVEKSLLLTLSKKDKDTLNVTDITVETETQARNGTKATERFVCGNYTLGGSKASETRSCNSGSSAFETVKAVNVTIGADGTDNAVKIEICSDVNNFCCRTILQTTGVSSLLSDDWSKGDVEVWRPTDLLSCQNILYRISETGGPRFTLVKDGIDDLIVDKIIVDTESEYGRLNKYDCGAFKLVGDCSKANSPCTQTQTCKKLQSSQIKG